MADLTARYLGMQIKNPVIVGSSELTSTVDKNVALAQAGAGALVLKSLFEEQIMIDVDAERVNNMFGSYRDTENYMLYYLRKNNLSRYLELVRDTKKAVDIPVIASINCLSSQEWVSFASELEEAGADGLELNIFLLPADLEQPSGEVENIYFSIVEEVLARVNIPVAIKISSYFSSLAWFVTELSRTGIAGIVLFNRFYSPDIDTDSEKIISTHIYSDPDDIGQTLRWTGILSGSVSCGLISSTGIHSGNDVVKNILVGADAVQVVSTLYRHGTVYIGKMLDDIEAWMDKKGYENLDAFRGKLSRDKTLKPAIFERAQFMRYFSDAF